MAGLTEEPGLRGGEVRFDDQERTIHLDGVRFVRDVAVSGRIRPKTTSGASTRSTTTRRRESAARKPDRERHAARRGGGGAARLARGTRFLPRATSTFQAAAKN
jgi:hypothetical protein